MRKVLVVEDNADNSKIVKYALARAGYEVILAEGGEEGIDFAVRELPDLILMDVNLPGIDGLEATKRIRAAEVGRRVPIVAITSHAMAGDRERILAAGCDGHIEKPIDPITLVECIHNIIGIGSPKP